MAITNSPPTYAMHTVSCGKIVSPALKYTFHLRNWPRFTLSGRKPAATKSCTEIMSSTTVTSHVGGRQSFDPGNLNLSHLTLGFSVRKAAMDMLFFLAKSLQVSSLAPSGIIVVLEQSDQSRSGGGEAVSLLRC